MVKSLHNANLPSTPLVCRLSDDRAVCVLQTNYMARKVKSELPPAPLHFLKEWREFRKLTQEQLADAVDTNKSQIWLLEASAFEKGEKNKRGLSPKWARRLAKALRIQPGWLLDHDPNNLSPDLIEVWAGIPKDRQDQAIKTLQSFMRKTG